VVSSIGYKQTGRHSFDVYCGHSTRHISGMPIPLWVLLIYAVWTVLVLLAGVGVHRWSRILSRTADLTDFPADKPEGPPFYRRAMRAHANCLENLPIYAAFALIAAVIGLDTPWLDQLALTVLAGRIGQTLIHMALAETNVTVAIRFVFFFVQLAAMLGMAIIIARTALA
jgi:uncharacterized MAPEG superfamily protein